MKIVFEPIGPTSKDESLIDAHKVDAGLFDLSALDLDSAVELVDQMIQSNANHYICFSEANILSHTRRNPKVREALQKADAVFADGTAVVKLAAIYGHQLPGRVTGPSFFLEACSKGVSRNWRHFFMGGGEGIADKLKRKMEVENPGIQIVDTYCPPFRELTDEEHLQLSQRIKDSGADLLWIAFGGPKQELWMAKNCGKMDVPVMLGVGAAFDFHTGNRPWAPRFIRAIGMEWAFRMFTGGIRTMIRNVQCVSDTALFLILEWIRVRVLRKRRNQKLD